MGVQIVQFKGAILGEMTCLACLEMFCRELCKNGWTDWDAIWVVDSGGPKEPVVGYGSRLPQAKGAIFSWKDVPGAPDMPDDTLPWAVQKWLTDRDAVWVVDLDGPKEACIRWGAHWQNLANAIEPSMWGGPGQAAVRPFCQITGTLTTCYCYNNNN